MLVRSTSQQMEVTGVRPGGWIRHPLLPSACWEVEMRERRERKMMVEEMDRRMLIKEDKACYSCGYVCVNEREREMH